MKTIYRIVPVVLGISLLLVSCGYRNPNVYSGPEKSIYVKTWKNRSNELRLDMQIYQSLVKWFQKSGAITVTDSKDNADYILAGEIISIDKPSLSYGAGNTTKQLKLKLNVRYIMQEISTGKIVLEVSSEQRTETYKKGGTKNETTDNEAEAMETIIDELSQKIYRAAITGILRSEQQQQ